MVNEASGQTTPYWQAKSLSEMNSAEWEDLCDGCGLCCLLKLIDDEDETIYYTSVACERLDRKACRCSDYSNRKEIVPSCIILTPENVSEIPWLPGTCAYRLIGEGKELYWWHHLVSGSRETVHQAGISVRDKVHSEQDVSEEDLEDYIIGSLEDIE